MKQEELELAIQDFRFFLKYTWKHLRLPVPTRMQLYIADYLQIKSKRKQLQALRGIGKTWITGAYVCWRLLRNPNEKVLIVSQTGNHADNISIFIRKLINSMDILQHLIPDEKKGCRTSNISFDVVGCEIAVQPSVRSLGISSQLQGNRATLLISDDVEGQQNSATEIMRDKLLSQVAEYEAILQTGDNSEILVLGTPQSAESIYNRLRDKGYLTRIFPARYPEDIDVYKGCLAEYIIEDINKRHDLIGCSIDSRFSDEDLFQRELSYGLSGFKLQFMLDTTLSDSEKYPLKTKDLLISDLEYTTAPTGLIWSSDRSTLITEIPNIGFSGDRYHRSSSYGKDIVDYEGKLLAIDPSGRGGDETGIAVVNHLHGKLYVPYIGGLSGGYGDKELLQIASIARQYEVNKILIESNFGDGMFSKLLQSVLNAVYPCMIEEVRSTKQKELRIIETLEPLMNQHRLVLDYTNISTDVNKALQSGNKNSMSYSFIYQLTHISRDRNSLRHDDKLDALALGVQYWNERNILKQNTDEALSTFKQKQLEDEISRRADIFKRFNLGSKKTPTVKPSLVRFKGFR